jgi:hypothetical protein
MKKLYWFTSTNFDSNPKRDYSFDLTKYIETFTKGELWAKEKYRDDYRAAFKRDDLNKIRLLKLHFHCADSPYSNLHSYERILAKYIDISQIDRQKRASSGINRASRIAVIEMWFDSQYEILGDLTYEQEKDFDFVAVRLSDETSDSWEEQKRLKAMACEFAQFFMFNLHLNYLTKDYAFSFKQSTDAVGLCVVTDGARISTATEITDLLSHYVFYDSSTDIMDNLMTLTSEFWSKNIPSIHFFVASMRGDYVNTTNFIKLVFTLESFFAENISNDYISLTIPLVLDKNVSDMRTTRQLIRECFKLRNKIVHGNSMVSFSSAEDDSPERLFFSLKNLITRIFYFYLNNRLFEQGKLKLTHELIFDFLPTGIPGNLETNAIRTKKSKQH